MWGCCITQCAGAELMWLVGRNEIVYLFSDSHSSEYSCEILSIPNMHGQLWCRFALWLLSD